MIEDHAVPGFFTRYRSFADVQNQLQAPLFMPILCLKITIDLGVEAIKHLILAAVSLVTLDLTKTWDNSRDTFKALAAGIAATGGAYTAVKGYFSTPTSTTEDDSDDDDSDDDTSRIELVQ